MLPLLLVISYLCCFILGAKSETSFSVDFDNNRFLLDGKPFRYISGSIHYSRVHPQQWLHRLKKIRSLGFNAIQYYVPWNFHELHEGNYEFSGMHNFTEFSRIAMHHGMYTLIRVGPYVCAEWENGGLPWWLLNKKEDIKMRSYDEIFLEAVDKWFSVLLPIVKPMLRQNGGPVLMVQIENEYGSYDACDRKYTEWLRDLTRKHLGPDVVLYTTDGNSDSYLKCGVIPGVLPTVDFGPSNPQAVNQSFLAQRKYLPKGPLVNSEYYDGWLVLWGQKEQKLPTRQEVVDTAKTMYEMGANINFYLIHGGTNFGFWNGAEPNAPCITSYDYSAPISEAGDSTPVFHSIRQWIKSIEDWPNRPTAIPKDSLKESYGMIAVKHVDTLQSLLSEKTCVVAEKPVSFEKLLFPLGFIMYFTTLDKCGTNLTIPMLKDFGYVYLNNDLQGTFVNRFENTTIREVKLEKYQKGQRLHILVENQGRQTYETINDRKGILSDVYLDGEVLTNWTHCKLNLPLMAAVVEERVRQGENGMNDTPKVAGDHGVYFGEMNVDRVADTFIDTTGWGKGVVIVNGHNLGRYWAAEGPQMTLYVPAPFLQLGPNSVMIIELLGANHDCHDGFCTMNSIVNPIFNFTKSAGADDRSIVLGRRRNYQH